MSDRIFEIEHHPNEEIVLRLKSPRLWGLPDPTKQHLLAAQKELLLALRSVVDSAIEVTETLEQERKKTKTKIDVQ